MLIGALVAGGVSVAAAAAAWFKVLAPLARVLAVSEELNGQPPKIQESAPTDTEALLNLARFAGQSTSPAPAPAQAEAETPVSLGVTRRP